MQTTITIDRSIVQVVVIGPFVFTRAEETISRLFLYAIHLNHRTFLVDIGKMRGAILSQEIMSSISAGKLYVEHYECFRYNPLRIAVVTGGQGVFSLSPGVHCFFDSGITLFIANDKTEAKTWLLATPTAGGGIHSSQPW